VTTDELLKLADTDRPALLLLYVEASGFKKFKVWRDVVEVNDGGDIGVVSAPLRVLGDAAAFAESVRTSERVVKRFGDTWFLIETPTQLEPKYVVGCVYADGAFIEVKHTSEPVARTVAALAVWLAAGEVGK